ncbi:hypothetical protein QCA50_019308 [Cerrena zonata]|uniref:Uncharacterized protein n=1 Tax=Cerrena zonata TaxID=2478898 RepID=A0AAW0FB89_9APHY
MHAEVSSPASIVRAADILLTRLDDTCQLPTELLDLVNDVLLRTYPPSAREVVKSIWLLRTLTNLISSCEDSAETLFRNIWQGVSVWIADECKAVEEDYVPELGILYQTILVSAQTLQTSLPMLDILAPILHSAFIGPKANLPDSISAFAEFWQATYAEMDEPEKGWSKEIKVCLRAIDKPGDDDSELESSEVEEHLTAVDDHARSLSPEIELLQPAFEVHLQEDSALERSPYLFTTPGKRRKSPAAVEFPSMLAPSMSPSSSPKRLPVTPKKRLEVNSGCYATYRTRRTVRRSLSLHRLWIGS